MNRITAGSPAYNAQVYVSVAAPDPTLFQPIENDPSPIYEKPKGGMWTSTLSSETFKSDWIRFSVTNSFFEEGEEAWEVHPDPGIELFVIDSGEDLDEIVEEYGRFEEESDVADIRGRQSVMPDFEEMAEDVDGVWLTKDGQFDVRQRSDAPELVSWDVESTIFFSYPDPTNDPESIFDGPIPWRDLREEYEDRRGW